LIYGIDIGGTKIELVVFSDALEELWRKRIETPVQSYPAFLGAVSGLIDEADQQFGKRAVVGIGLPGLVDAQGRSLCANVPCATGQYVAQDLSRQLDRFVVVENDCRLFALSEAKGGAGQGHQTVFGAILGTGAAGGTVIDGKLARGGRGMGGEYGHLPLPALIQQEFDLPLWPCACGLLSCAEAYVTGPGLLKRLSPHFGVPAEQTSDLIAAWRSNDAAAKRIFDCLTAILGATLASVVKVIDPDIIVMGGGLSLVDEIVAAMPDAISGHLFEGFASPPVVAAKFGDSSGARGAAILAQMQGAA
jgi:N-acetylglucosamine kinase